jgi:stress response protein YsnF
MSSRFSRKWALVVVTGLLTASIGCQQLEPPSVKRARLVAAQYMELEKAIADLNAKVETLKSQYDQQLKEKEEQLAAYRQKIEAFQTDVQQAISNRVNQVTAAVLDDNARLRKEIESLRVQLQQRMDNPPSKESKPQP